MSKSTSPWKDKHHVTPRTLRRAAPSGVVPRILWWNPAWYSLFAALGLTLIGIIAITQADTHRGTRQLIFLGVAVVGCVMVTFPRPHVWRASSYALAALVTLMLVFVLIPFVPRFLVQPHNGARRWINLQFIEFQPSELAKIVLVMALANYLRVRKNYRTLIGLLIPFGIMFVPMVLILVEPDLGTAMLFPTVLFAMLVAGGAKLWHLITIGSLGVGSLALIAVISLAAANVDPPRYPLLEKHQVARIQALVNQIQGDERQRDTINYQAYKAMTLIGAGGFQGLGEDRSRVIVHHNRLPEDYNDMIFAVVVNRWGFIGATVLMGLYFIYILGFVAVAAITKNAFGRLVCVGFATITASQMMVNIGMTVGLLPITGMNLPFVSSGGSSLVANYIMVGIVLNIALRPANFFARTSFEFDPEREDPDPLDRLR